MNGEVCPGDPLPPGPAPADRLAEARRLDLGGRHREALVAYEGYLETCPEDPGAWADYGGLRMLLGDLERAEGACLKALELIPDCPPAVVNLAHVRLHLGRLDEAEYLLRSLLLRQPQNRDALLALADVYLTRMDFARARKPLADLLALEPAHPEALARMNNLRIHTRDWAALRVDMESQLNIFAGAEAEYERSHLALLYGELPQAWEGFERRWEIPGRILLGGGFESPKWHGEAFGGRTLLVHSEQGLGDTLMFLRYLPLVKARGGIVRLMVQRELLELAATAGGADSIHAVGDSLPPHDVWITLPSLPWVFRTALDTIPADIPYLDVPACVPHREDFSGLLHQASERRRIALVWAGNPAHRRDGERSIPGPLLEPLADLPHTAWFSFQRDRRDLPSLPGLTSLEPLLGSFGDTAFALRSMDLVITVDTALAHLAGALGIPTRLLVTFRPDWRWMLERDDSPWYPSLRIVRQELPGDWEGVVRRLRADLEGPRV